MHLMRGRLLPAHPGAAVLDLVVEPSEGAIGADRLTVIASPILAWLVRRGRSTPITVRGLGDGQREYADLPIEFPSGAIISTGAGAWPDRTAWIAGMTGGSGYA